MEQIVIFTPTPILFGCSNQENKMGSACAIHGEDRNAFNVIIGKPEGKRSLGTLRRR
jgi:hypothetical protein